MDPNCYFDNEIDSSNDLQIYIKEKTKDLKDHLKWEEYTFDTYEDGKLVKYERRPCQNYDELTKQLNKRFQYERKWVWYYSRHYEEFVNDNYSEEEIFDIVTDLIQSRKVYENADFADITEIPLYVAFVEFWRGAHRNYKKKFPKSIVWLIQATEVALRNTYPEGIYISNDPSQLGVEECAKLISKQRARRRELRKWLVDTRRGNSDNTREEHIRKWHENFKEFLTFEGDAAYKDTKIIEAAKHYGIELT